MIATRRRLLAGLGCCCLLPHLAACKTVQVDPVASGYKPVADSDEAGIWQISDRIEEDLRRSPSRLGDGTMETYLAQVACRLAGDHCPDIRVYLVHAPYFNASMSPNGMMQVWSGLLLRVDNEAQLAAILGHEIGHYVERHTLERWRSIRASLAVSQIVGMGLGVAGGGGLANLPTLVALAQIYAYNREQEREADRIGMELMARAGYAPIEASRVWRNLIDESAVDPYARERDIFFATHPAPQERRDALQATAASLEAPGQVAEEARYLAEARTMRGMLLDDEIGLRQSERSIVVIERLRRQEPDDGALTYYLGEVYRLRGDGGDAERALALYEEASGLPGAPPELWRSSGLVLRRQSRDDEAAEAFSRYLALRPDAPDAAIIRSYIPQTS